MEDHATKQSGTAAETLVRPEDSGQPEEFKHYRELGQADGEEEIYAAGGWISGHCGDPRCAL